jgi:DNA-directed RNA polymerase specialized sigma24 family protein
MRKREQYRRAKLNGNDVFLVPPDQLSGERVESDVYIDREQLAVDPQNELKVDLAKAFETFSTLEKRVLVRVLIQGQSINEATKHMKGSLRSWQYWYSREAFPRLQEKLGDYFTNGHVAL